MSSYSRQRRALRRTFDLDYRPDSYWEAAGLRSDLNTIYVLVDDLGVPCSDDAFMTPSDAETAQGHYPEAAEVRALTLRLPGQLLGMRGLPPVIAEGIRWARDAETLRKLAMAFARLVATGDGARRLEALTGLDDMDIARARSQLTDAAAAAGTIGVRVGADHANAWLAVFACTHPDPREAAAQAARYTLAATAGEARSMTRERIIDLLHQNLGSST